MADEMQILNTTATRRRTLPPGQRRVDGFPRFGTHLHRPPPAAPKHPVIVVDGALTAPLTLARTELAALPRRTLTADFHCVAGWSATDLRWEGIPFEVFYQEVIEPSLRPEVSITHMVFEGLDGYRSIATIDDALAADVLIADRLDGRPLDGDHGAPLRLVSPSQYGFMSTKHLSRIEVHTTRPPEQGRSAVRVGPVKIEIPLIVAHPRARVWREERHAFLPAGVLRPIYRRMIAPIAAASARGSLAGQTPPRPPHPTRSPRSPRTR